MTRLWRPTFVVESTNHVTSFRVNKVVCVARLQVTWRVVRHLDLFPNLINVIGSLSLPPFLRWTLAFLSAIEDFRAVGGLHPGRVPELEHFLLRGQALGTGDAVLVWVSFIEVLLHVRDEELPGLQFVAKVVKGVDLGSLWSND